MQIKTKLVGEIITSMFIGIGSIVGSGWLFASYYASQTAGPAAILSWILGAVLALLIAFLLAEIATMFPLTGLFGRLLSISHNKDIGFVVAISNLGGLMVMIPSEAEATAQYISTTFPSLTPYIFVNHEFTAIGTILVAVLLLVYTLVNYWGLKSLSKVNNTVTAIKIVIPAAAALLFMYASFHPGNFSSVATGGFMPYGVGSIFSAVVNSGIFYAFFGFQFIVIFASEYKESAKIMPIALISSIAVCLVIYLLLQISFIGAVPSGLLSSGGWKGVNFTSPLAQLAILLGLNFVAVVLYLDACVSPSGTGAVYMGAASRSMAGMSHDKQMPNYFAHLHPVYNFSRRTLIFTLIFCTLVICLFKSWQSIVILVTVFQLLSCIAVPLAFYRLRKYQPDLKRPFRVKFGMQLSVFIFVLMTYLMTLAGLKAVIANLVVHAVCFAIYTFVYNKGNVANQLKAFYSCWTMFLFLIYLCIATYVHEYVPTHLNSIYGLIIFIIITIGFFYLLVHQKNYSEEKALVHS